MDVRDPDLVAFERRQRQLPTDEINVALIVGDDQIPSAARACRDVDLLKTENVRENEILQLS
jgi:hypothetical protein